MYAIIVNKRVMDAVANSDEALEIVRDCLVFDGDHAIVIEHFDGKRRPWAAFHRRNGHILYAKA